MLEIQAYELLLYIQNMKCVLFCYEQFVSQPVQQMGSGVMLGWRGGGASVVVTPGSRMGGKINILNEKF